MWIFTVDGFYSVVRDGFCEPYEVVVRARSEQDLVNIIHNFEKPKIIILDEADYRYRMIVPKQLWARYLMNATKKIDYPNFKNKIHEEFDDPERSHAMGLVWLDMLNF